MAKIRQLSNHITNMIAAGEVVERPMGIVKECVENSIDAHATHIEVHIMNGGLSKITIIDDGDGMDHEDAAMALNVMRQVRSGKKVICGIYIHWDFVEKRFLRLLLSVRLP